MANKVTIKYKGHSVSCFGEMHPEQNIQVCCNNENYDDIFARGFNNWTEAVHFIVDYKKAYFPDPVQMEAI